MISRMGRGEEKRDEAFPERKGEVRRQEGLSVENLKVSLQEKEILHGISLRAEPGEFISLLGESGCGKSTLLKSIAGLLEPEEGEIFLEGSSLLEIPPQKRGTVIVFQDLRLFPHMTVEKNIAFPMELKKIPKDIQKETVERLLEGVQLSGYGKRKIRQLSGGQMQRVALARALAAKPRLLLLDEPFSGLDERLRAEMGALVAKLHRKMGLTTVLVTHDRREALKLSDRIVLMGEGKVIQCGTPWEMFYRPVSREAAEYFGKANYLKGTVEGGRFKSRLFEAPVCFLGEGTGRCKAEGLSEAIVRPFFVRLTAKGDYPVREVIFMGELAEAVVETPEGPIRSQMMSRELERLGIEKGGRVGIEIEEAYCF